MGNLADDRSKLAAATRMTASLREAVGSQCRAASARENKSMLEVLTPAQTVKLNEWVSANKERCHRVLNKKRATPEKDTVWKEQSLFEFCRRLDEVLRISKK